MTEPIEQYVVTSHAVFEMQRRKIAKAVVRRMLAAPEQRHPVLPSRRMPQSRAALTGKTYMVRVFVDIDRNPAEVVSVYPTRQIARYWRAAP